MPGRRSALPLFCSLYQAFGPQGWWPAHGIFEMALGAILTQGVNWNNASTALRNLQQANLMDPLALLRATETQVAGLVRPAGYFNVKARKLQVFSAAVLREPEGLHGILNRPTAIARNTLLSIWGIGPETADSILLYGGSHPVMVIDAYTHRILYRHGWATSTYRYEQLRSLLEESLPRDVSLLQEMHALMVRVARQFCARKKPLCWRCPLQNWNHLQA